MLLFTAALLGTLASAPAADTTIAVTKGTRLDVNNFSGRVTVTAWNRDEVQLHWTSSDDDAGIRIQRSSGEIRVAQDMRNGPTEIDLTINAPAWMALSLQGNETDIVVAGMTASVRAQSVDGDITLSGGADNVSVNSVSGAVRVDGTRGNLDIQSVDGDITARAIVGTLTVQGVDGDVRLEEITSSAVRVTTVDGNIHFGGAIATNGTYSFKTHDGDIAIRPAGALNATVSVSTFSGDFESASPVTISGSQDGKRFSFTVGTGSARLELEAFDGQIRLEK
jgi:DUF4097 and DUF4098 domain-containing protein YvlB